jgi:hypothetical protein
LIEVLDRHDRHFQSAHLPKGKKPTKAIVVPRPREVAKRKSRRNATGEELAAMVKRLGGAKVAGRRAS